MKPQAKKTMKPRLINLAALCVLHPKHMDRMVEALAQSLEVQGVPIEYRDETSVWILEKEFRQLTFLQGPGGVFDGQQLRDKFDWFMHFAPHQVSMCPR